MGDWFLTNQLFLWTFMLHCTEWWGSHATRRKRSWENDSRSLCSVAFSIPFNWKVLFSSFFCINYLVLNCIFWKQNFFFAMHSKRIRNIIADYLPDRNVAVLVPVLERFVVWTCFDIVIQNTYEAWKKEYLCWYWIFFCLSIGISFDIKHDLPRDS